MMKKTKRTKDFTAAMSADMKQVAARIREHRESIGLSRPKFAEILEMPPTTLKNYELRYRTTGGEFLVKFGKQYGAERLLWLMGLDTPNG